MNESAIKALQIYMYEETKKFGVVNEYTKIIRENPTKAFKELGIVGIVTPGFIKYFEDYEYETIDFKEYGKLFTIKDLKFEFFDDDCKCELMMKELFRLSHDSNVKRFMILQNLGIKLKTQYPDNILESMYKIKSFKTDFEMGHEKMGMPPFNIGNIHVVKEGEKYIIVNGNHRVLGFMYYCLTINRNYAPIKIWLGTKTSKVIE